MNKIIYRSSLAIVVLLLFACSTKRTYTMASPGHNNQLRFDLTQTGQPQYQFSSNGKTVIEPSLLGFEFQDIKKMTEGFKIIQTEVHTVDQTWEQPWGEFKRVRDRHNELIVHLKEADGEQRLVDLIFRVFDDGLGFRYSFPAQPNLGKVKISNETSLEQWLPALEDLLKKPQQHSKSA